MTNVTNIDDYCKAKLKSIAPKKQVKKVKPIDKCDNSHCPGDLKARCRRHTDKTQAWQSWIKGKLIDIQMRKCADFLEAR